jgi:O-acetyl-ADP-ribose deacetylase (regulator of RNase III)
MIVTITGDLLDAKEKYIAHQANCVSHMAAGIAYSIFNKYPYSDIYAIRYKKDEDIITNDEPGNNIIKGNGKDQRFVINMLSQYYPGGPKQLMVNGIDDDEIARQKYFHKCLIKISKIEDLESIAFPAGIGCNLAGGDWEWYYEELKIFADFIYMKQNAKTVIYQLPGLNWI